MHTQRQILRADIYSYWLINTKNLRPTRGENISCFVDFLSQKYKIIACRKTELKKDHVNLDVC